MASETLKSKPPKQKKSRLFSRELEGFVGPINADIYRDIERAASAVNEILSSRQGKRKPGRPSKDASTTRKVREEILRLLTRCHQSSVPPPMKLIEALARAWPSAGTGETTKFRAKQMQKAADMEAEHLVRKDGKAEFGASLSALSEVSGADRKTIREWRESNPEYHRLLLDAVAAKLSARLS